MMEICHSKEISNFIKKEVRQMRDMKRNGKIGKNLREKYVLSVLTKLNQ